MIRSVFDANTVVASFPAKQGTMATVLDRWRVGAFGLILSEYILDEITIAWSKPYWRARMSQHEIESALTLLRRDAEITPITTSIEGVATHSEDDMIIATALGAQVDYIVTGDKELQELRTYSGVRIVSPREFLAILDTEASDDAPPSPAAPPT